MEKPNEATTKAANLDQPTANNTAKMKVGDPGKTYPSKANESDGVGSPYGGTQNANDAAPDGNQQVNTQAADKQSGIAKLPEGLGDEYDSQSSYGEEGSNKEGDRQGGNDARGSSVS